MKEDKSECTIKKQKDAKNEVACDVTNYFNVSNVFESGKTILTCHVKECAWLLKKMKTFKEIIDTLNKYQDRHGQRLSSKNLKEAVRRLMDEEEEEIERNINNITCDTPFKSPVTKNVQKKYANWSLERQLAAGVLEKMVK